MNCIFIGGNVPSSKNSKIWTGKRLINSKNASSYIKKTASDYEKNKDLFLDMIKGLSKPYKVAFFFVRDSRRNFDANNISQVVTDLMVKNGWIEDDNMNEMWPVFVGFTVDKDNSGIYISVLDEDYNSIIKDCVNKLKCQMKNLEKL